jgi:hypothetical protein
LGGFNGAALLAKSTVSRFVDLSAALAGDAPVGLFFSGSFTVLTFSPGHEPGLFILRQCCTHSAGYAVQLLVLWQSSSSRSRFRSKAMGEASASLQFRNQTPVFVMGVFKLFAESLVKRIVGRHGRSASYIRQ